MGGQSLQPDVPQGESRSVVYAHGVYRIRQYALQQHFKFSYGTQTGWIGLFLGRAY